MEAWVTAGAGMVVPAAGALASAERIERRNPGVNAFSMVLADQARDEAGPLLHTSDPRGKD